MDEYVAKTKSKGMGLTGMLFVFIVICIFLTGFDYRQAYHRWNEDSPSRVVGVLQLTFVVVAFVVVLLSFLSFSACSNSRGVILLVSLFPNSC